MRGRDDRRAPRRVPADFFALRTPLLPFDAFEALAAGALMPGALADPAATATAVAEDRATQRRRLRELASRPAVREALFLASPDLEGTLDLWLSEPESERGRRVERSLLRYLTRMCSRPTPFGLCAAIGAGRVGGDRSRLAVEPARACRRLTRLEFDALVALTGALGREPAVREALRFRVNSSLYALGDRVRYVEAREREGERTLHLVAVEGSPELGQVLDTARDGATLAELAALLVNEEVDLEEARGFVDELADGQLLVPELAVPLTGPDPAAALVAKLASRGETAAAAAGIDSAAAALVALDAAGLGAPASRYREVASSLAALPFAPRFHVDLIRPAPAARLGERVLAELRRGVELLHAAMPPRPSALRAFAAEFEERYGTREVPLVEALDEEAGIGFPAWAGEDAGPAPLLEGVRFPGADEETVRWGTRERHLLRLLSRALADGRQEIELAPEDLEALTVPDAPPLPRAFAAQARLAAASDEALGRGDFRLFCEAASGPSGADFLGRFVHADPELRCGIEAHLAAEEALEPEALFAEIVHLPAGRWGSLLARPVFRGHEIPFLGEAGVEAERRIPVTDLTLRVRKGEVILRSARLGRRILPRLTSAQNYLVHGLGLYRFLGTLQAQGTSGGAVWDWGALGTAPFLPRISAGRVILSLARWSVAPEELAPLAEADGTPRWAALAAWRVGRGVPRRVCHLEGDTELLVDFDSVLSVEAWLRAARHAERTVLREMFPGAAMLCATGPEGRYVHDLLVLFHEEPTPEPPAGGRDAETPRAAPVVCRSFPPGSEWLSAKLYGGRATLDRLLREQLGAEAQELVAAGVADRWFFVRYADPRPHLRLRLHGEPRRLREEAWARLGASTADLLADGQIWKVQLDTYEREVERFGGPEAIEAVERLFHADSDAALGLLQRLEAGDEGEEERWRLALVGADRWLDDFGFSLAAKRALADDLRRAWGREHREDAELRQSLAERFRRRRGEIAALLGGDVGFPSALGQGLEVFSRRSAAVREPLAELFRLEGEGRLTVDRPALAGSIVHMFLNRWLATAHRRQELVLWDVLARGYLGRREAPGRARDEEP